MLTASELSTMRTIEESVMTSTAIIRRNTPLRDVMGGFTDSWSAIGTVNCDLWPVGNRGDRENTTSGGQLISHADWFITVPYNTDVIAQDRIDIDGKTFEIVFVPNNISWNTALRIEAKTFNEEYRV